MSTDILARNCGITYNQKQKSLNLKIEKYVTFGVTKHFWPLSFKCGPLYTCLLTASISPEKEDLSAHMIGQQPGTVLSHGFTRVTDSVSKRVRSHETHLLLFLHPCHKNSGRSCLLGGDVAAALVFYSIIPF